MEEITTPNAGQNLTDAEFFGAAPKQYAGFWLRLVAALLDGIILNIVTAPVSLLFGVASPFSMNSDVEITGAYLGANAVILVIQWLYYAGMESSSMQATLGKRALGIIVTDEDGLRISFANATGRYFAKILSALIIGIGYIMAAFTEKKQALHDILAHTLVVKKPAGFKHS